MMQIQIWIACIAYYAELDKLNNKLIQPAIYTGNSSFIIDFLA